MSKDKNLSIFLRQMEAIAFTILQIFFATRVVLKIGEYPRISPVLAGNIRSRDVFRPIAREQNYLIDYKYMLFAGWEVRIVKNCVRDLQNAFSRTRSHIFPIRTDPKPANNVFIFFLRYVGLQVGLFTQLCH